MRKQVTYQVTIKEITGYIWKFKTHMRPIIDGDSDFINVVLNGGAVTSFNKHHIITLSIKPISGRHTEEPLTKEEVDMLIEKAEEKEEDSENEEDLDFPNSRISEDLDKQMVIEEIIGNETN